VCQIADDCAALQVPEIATAVRPHREPGRSLMRHSIGLHAARCGRLAVLAAMASGLACATPAQPPIEEPGPASQPPGTCSWFGDAWDDVLYFGESAFWHAMREAGGDPQADLGSASPQLVGRFDLRREAMLAPLASGLRAAHSGTWDVVAHPNGRVYFTSFYDPAGWVDPASGAAQRFDAAGTGLNEITVLPDGRLLATRYGAPGGGDGSIVILDVDGRVVVEHALVPEPGAVVAAKSLAFDPIRNVVWVNTDVIANDGSATRFDARVVELATGREISRFTKPELHFPRFDRSGRGYFAWVDGARAALHVTEPGAALGPDAGRAIVLDAAFPHGLDFVQEVRVQRDGRVVATRWSGWVHVVSPDGGVRNVALPRDAGDGFYYTGVAVGERVCATYCAGVRVVCADLP
jgi:hypothetical protein